MDYYDREILRMLLENSRTPYSRIAEAIGIPEETVRYRVRRLVRRGVIRRFTLEVNFESSANE